MALNAHLKRKGQNKMTSNARSLSDLGIVGCNLAAAVHFWLRRTS